MPDANGLELIPKIKEIRPEIKIIIISAQNTLLTAMQAIEKGAYEYLSKPFSLSEINKIINRAFSESTKNKNEVIDKEAKNELNNVCGSSLWESLGFVFFDQLEDSEKIAKANFYYGQLQIINEIKFSI